MKPLALFVITSDPRVSGRPVEGLRIAAGIAAWRRVEVALYLSGAAVLTVAEDTDELIEWDNLSNYIPLLRDLGRPVYIDAGFSEDLREATVPIAPLDHRGLAQLASQSYCVLRF